MENLKMTEFKELNFNEIKYVNGGAISPQSHLQGYAKTSLAMGIFALGSAITVLSIMAGFGDGLKAGVK